MTRVQIIAGLVPTIPHNDLIVPPPPNPSNPSPSPSSFLPINLHSIARLINDVKGVLGREPGPRHLAYCLSAPLLSSLVRNYSATMNQPSCQPFSDRQPIIHPTSPTSLLCYRRGAYYDRWIKCTIAAPVSVPSGREGEEGVY